MFLYVLEYSLKKSFCFNWKALVLNVEVLQWKLIDAEAKWDLIFYFSLFLYQREALR